MLMICVFWGYAFCHWAKVFYVAFQIRESRIERARVRTSPRATLNSGAQGAELQEPFVDVRSSLVGRGGVYLMLWMYNALDGNYIGCACMCLSNCRSHMTGFCVTTALSANARRFSTGRCIRARSEARIGKCNGQHNAHTALCP